MCCYSAFLMDISSLSDGIKTKWIIFHLFAIFPLKIWILLKKPRFFEILIDFLQLSMEFLKKMDNFYIFFCTETWKGYRITMRTINAKQDNFSLENFEFASKLFFRLFMLEYFLLHLKENYLFSIHGKECNKFAVKKKGGI